MQVAAFRRAGAITAATARKAGNTITSENGDKVLRDPHGHELARIPKKQPRGRVVPMNVAECACVEYPVYVAAVAERQRVGPKGEHLTIIVDGKAHEAWVSVTRAGGSHVGVAPEWTMTFFSTGTLTSDPVQGVLATVSGYGVAAPVTSWSTAPIMELMAHRGEVL